MSYFIYDSVRQSQSIPVGITHFKINWFYEYDIPITIPNSVTHLDIYCSVFYNFNVIHIPHNVKCLKIHRFFNYNERQKTNKPIIIIPNTILDLTIVYDLPCEYVIPKNIKKISIFKNENLMPFLTFDVELIYMLNFVEHFSINYNSFNFKKFLQYSNQSKNIGNIKYLEIIDGLCVDILNHYNFNLDKLKITTNRNNIDINKNVNIVYLNVVDHNNNYIKSTIYFHFSKYKFTIYNDEDQHIKDIIFHKDFKFLAPLIHEELIKFVFNPTRIYRFSVLYNFEFIDYVNFL